MTDGLSLREFLTFRLDNQDRKLEGMDKRITTIDENTNGRLKELETERRVLIATKEQAEKHYEKRFEKRWKWSYLLSGIVTGGVAGAAFGGIGHALGWW